MINKIKIKPCASLPDQGVKMSNVSQNADLHGTWWSWIFMWSKTLFKVYFSIIWTTVWYQILIFCIILKLLDLQNIAQLKRKRKLIMGAKFVTFDNAVNAMPRIIRKCGLYGCTQKLFMSFLLPADYPPCGLSGGNYGTAEATTRISVTNKSLRYLTLTMR